MMAHAFNSSSQMALMQKLVYTVSSRPVNRATHQGPISKPNQTKPKIMMMMMVMIMMIMRLSRYC